MYVKFATVSPLEEIPSIPSEHMKGEVLVIRAIMTSGLTFLAVPVLSVFGWPVLDRLAFALVAGILTGAYATVFIASPVLIFWQDVLECGKCQGWTLRKRSNRES